MIPNFTGDLITPDHPSYESARSIWNATVQKRPALIARCKGVVDIVACVKFAAQRNLLTAIRGGGHNVGGRALCDDGLVIDLSLMRAIHVDPSTRRVRVQCGATLGDLDRETHAFGLAVPVGVVAKTGVAGLTLGGGVGWLVRKYGMSIDNLLSCQVVTASGEILNASASENEDLFWALRGGGGNFGVVVSMEFQAHPVSLVLGGMVMYPRADAMAVIRNYRDYICSAPDELTAYALLIHSPEGAPLAAIAACYCGDLAEGERALAPLRNFGQPVADLFQPMPFPVMQGLFAGAFPDGNQNYWKANMMATLPDAAIEVLVAQANASASPLSALVIENYSGAPSRVSNHSTAYSHRELPWHVIIAAQCTSPAEFPSIRAWARAAYTALEPYSQKAHFLTVLDADQESDVASAFGANLHRLEAIKKKYDPHNFFRVNQNIAPAP